MNRNCYRIIFNALRGQLMAVCESATGCGKAANAGDSPATDEEAGSTRPALCLTAILPIALAVAQLGLFSGNVSAQVVAYRNAPGNQQPTVLGSNGVPVVNVQSPSAAGVSRNTYSQFDVDEKGVVLNNSRKGANTHLAGPVSGNPWMAKGTAKVIVNEVISSNPSKLSGTVEVAGNRAEVVIANPSGVEVNGGRFINASKATITTGKPNFKNGAVDNYEVRQGAVNVGSKGLDASQTDYTAILARAVTVNGAVQAKELKIITGANQVSGDLKDVKPIAGKGAAPEYALDVSELGGMYAGKISMVGTEAGVGVRNAGKIVAGTGEINISVDGKVLNPGQIVAGGDIQIAATKSVTNKGRTYAQGALKINTQGTVTNTGLIASQGDLSIEATGDSGIIFSDKSAYLIAGLAPDGQLNAIANLTLNAGKSIQANGQSRATAEMTISAPSIDLSGGDLLAYNVRIEAILNQRRSRSRRPSEEGIETQETLLDGDINVDKAKLRAANLLQIEADGTLKTTDANVQAEQLAILVDTLDNKQGNIQVGSTGLIVAGSKVDNSAGKIDAQGTLAIVDSKMTDKVESETLAIVNTGGNLTAGQLLQLESASLSRDGHIASQGDLSLALHGDYAHGIDPTFYEAGGNISLSFTGTVSNQGVWHTDKNLSISASKIANTASSEIVADGTLTLVSNNEALSNRGLISGKQINFGGLGLDNAGGRIQGGALVINVAQGIDNQRGNIDIAGASQILAGGDMNNDGGRIDAGSLVLNLGGNLSNNTLANLPRAGITSRNGDLTLDVGGNFAMKGADLSATGNLSGFVLGDIEVGSVPFNTTVSPTQGPARFSGFGSFSMATLDSSSSETRNGHLTSDVHAGGDLSLVAGGNASLHGGNISAGGNLTLGAVTGNLSVTTLVDQIQTERNQFTANATPAVYDDSGAAPPTGGIRSTTKSVTQNANGGLISADGELKLLAGNDILLTGASAHAGGKLSVLAGHNLAGGSLAINGSSASQTENTTFASDDYYGQWQAPVTESGQQSRTVTQIGGDFSGKTGITFTAGQGNPFDAKMVSDIQAARPVANIAQVSSTQSAGSADIAPPPAGSITLTGVTLNSGTDNAPADLTLSAAGNLSVQAAWNSRVVTNMASGPSVLARLFSRLSGPSTVTTTDSSLGQLKGSNIHLQSDTGKLSLAGIDLQAKNDLTTYSGGDTAIDSSTVRANHDISVYAQGRLSINGMIENPTTVQTTAATTGNDHTPLSAIASLSAGNNMSLAGLAGVQARGVDLGAQHDLTVNTKGNLDLEGGNDHAQRGGDYLRDTARASTLTGQTMTLSAVGEKSHINLGNVALTSNGKTSLQATGNISIDPGVDYSYDHWTESHKSGGWFDKKTTTIDHVRESTTVRASSIKAGGLEILANGDITLTATKLDSQDTPTIKAGGDINYLAAHNASYAHDESHTRKSFLGITYGKSSSSHTASLQSALVTEIQSQADVLSYSEGSTLLVGTRIVSASGKVQVLAKQDINILPADNASFTKDTHQSWDLIGNSSTYAFNHRVKDNSSTSSTTLTGAYLSGDTVEVAAGGNAHLVGASLLGKSGVSLIAAGNILVEAGQETKTTSSEHYESGHGYGVVKTDGRIHYVGANENKEKQNQSGNSITPVLSVIDSSQGTVTIAGGLDVMLLGARINAQKDVSLGAGNRLILGGTASSLGSNNEQEKGTFICNMRDGTALERLTWTAVPGSIQAGGDLKLSAGRDVELGAVNLKTGGAVVFDTPEVKFVGEKNSDYLGNKIWDKDRGYEVNKGNGHVDETLTLTTIDAKGGVKLPDSTKVSVVFDQHLLNLIGDTKEPVTPEQFKQLANQLAQQPAMAYLADLAQRPDIDWQAVSTAHQHWDYKGQGLTQAGAIVLTVVVAILTSGAGAGVLDSAVGAGTGTVTTTTVTAGVTTTTTMTTVAGAIANAGLTSLATSAAISLANNGGDLGKTLHDLGSSQTMKGLVTSMLTAGLIQGVTPGDSLSTLSDASFIDRFTTYAAQATIKAGIQSVAYGRPLSETMKTALIDSLAQSLTSEIGDWAKMDGVDSGSLVKMLAHSIVQCAAASIANRDCGSAAVGAATAEWLSPLADRASGNWGNAISSMGAVLAASLLGKDVNTAYNAAQMVDYYNRQLHPWEKIKAAQIARKAAADGITNPDGSPITAKQIENAMRGANYGSETIITGMVVPLTKETPASAIYDTTGMQLVTDSSGKSYLVQNASMLASPSQTLRDLITENSGGTNSAYSWNTPSPGTKPDPYAGMAWTSEGYVPVTDGSNAAQRNAGESANGKYFNLPTTYCPPASCINFDSISWGTTNSEDQHKLGDYQVALGEQNTKALVKTGIFGLTLVMAPPTLGGSIVGGAILSGGNSLTDQLVDTGKVDAVKTFVATGGGATFGALGYGGFWLLGKGSAILWEVNYPASVTVTSWAETGIKPDLAPGRWVQLGDANMINFLKTGLPGPKVYLDSSSPFVTMESSNVPFSNYITGEVPASSLQWPSGWEKLKGVLGQRQITKSIDALSNPSELMSIEPASAELLTSTASELQAPVFSPAGADRAAKFGGNWLGVSAKETIANIAGESPVITYTNSGKTIYANPTTGMQVVYDNAGNYFRIENTSATGLLRFTDQFGKPIPSNVPLIQSSKTTQTGVPSDVRNALTHFKDVD